jgi:phosphatidylglycerophosphatase A
MPGPGTSLAGASGRAGRAVDRLALAVATAGGVGYAPVAPGTAGSAVALVLLWLVPFTPTALVLFFIAVTIAGTLAAHRAEPLLGGKDPGAIVIDEVAGMTLAVLVLPLTPAVLVVGFVLFRVFDIVKPPPAGISQRLPGGIGVMIDDLIAGLYALAILAGLAAGGWL